VNLLLLALLAGADDDPTLSADIQRFRPAADTRGYGVTEGSSTLGHLEVGVGLWGGYEEDSVLLRWDGQPIFTGEERGDGIIDRRNTVDLQLGFGLWDRLALAVDVPVVTWQRGFALEHLIDEDIDEDLIGAGITDVRGMVKVTVLDLDDGPVGLALLVEGSAPTGLPASFLGEGAPTLTPQLILEVADGSVRDKDYTVRAALNGGVHIRERDTFRDLVLDDAFVYAGALGVRPSPPVELGIEVYGSYGGPGPAQHSLELAPLLMFHPARDITVTAGGAVGLLPGVGTPDFRLFLGGTLSPSFDPRVRDRDKDGIVDKRDACVHIPEDLDGIEDLDGCPEDDADEDGILDPDDGCATVPEDLDGFEDEDGCPDLDNDEDGIADLDDDCPDESETFDGYQDDDGCPDAGLDRDDDGIPDREDDCPDDPEDRDGFEDEDGCPDPDNDGDGYLDGDDDCPDDAEVFNGWKDEDGCPDSADDSDGDGILDEVDGCPDEAEDRDGFEDEDGCPDPDNDQDGILDVDDDCPDEPEAVNGYLDEDGCPDLAPMRVKIEKTRIVIEEQIFFDVDRATIKAASDSLLDEIAQTMVDHPELVRVRIEGHTDSDGEALYNLRLSQARAEAVARALVERGVDEDRLEPVGFGETRPVASNGDALGKAKNRRVEFHIVERED
jgi:outer membrane protein OmpA-like peptidoglycan-associated protein